MAKKLSKRGKRWVIAAGALAVLAVAVIGFRYYKKKQNHTNAAEAAAAATTH